MLAHKKVREGGKGREEREMDKEAKKENTSPLPNCNNTINNHDKNNDNTIIDDSPTKRHLVGHSGGSCGLITAGGGSGSGNIGGNGDRLKRDEWSEGAVSCLLEAYESKWILRNRAKLKGHDWEDVAKYVASRANSTKSPKTQTQCKNKIESMKKRYRSESAAAEASSWPLFPRLDLLLRGSTAPVPPLLPPTPPALPSPPVMLVEPLTSQSLPPAASPLRPPPPPQIPAPPPPAAFAHTDPTPAAPVPIQLGSVAQNSHGSNGVNRVISKEDGILDTKMSDHHVSDKTATETDSSTPVLFSDKEEKLKSKINDHQKSTNYKKKRPRRREEDWADIAESIRWLAEVVVRSEQARAETMRELEKMRAEAEAKRGEIDLKRTEIIANTQLEIARLLAGVGKGVDPSLRIGRS